MRILWITPQLPCSIGGGQSRQLSLLHYLAQSHKVTVITLVSPEEQGHEGETRPHCHRLETIPYIRPKAMSRWHNRCASWKRLIIDPQPQYARTYPTAKLLPAIQRLLADDHFDLVHFEHLFVAPLRSTAGGLPCLLACQNVESQIARQRVSLTKHFLHRIFTLLEWRKLHRFERQWVGKFDILTAICSADAAVLQKVAPRTRVHIVPHGVNTAEFALQPDVGNKRGGLLFFGTMAYWPNVDGILYFCREIWPLILRHDPQVRLTIVGPNPTAKVEELARMPRITVTGFVPDIRPYLWKAALTIVPLRAGGGVRIKILEALAAGCPVVSTTVGAAGLDIDQEDGLFRADNPQEFAEQVVALLQDPGRQQALGQQGRATVTAHYDWSSVGPQLEEAYAAALSHP